MHRAERTMSTHAQTAAATVAAQTTAELFAAASQDWKDEELAAAAWRKTFTGSMLTLIDTAVWSKVLTRGLDSRGGIDPCYWLTISVPGSRDEIDAIRHPCFQLEAEIMRKLKFTPGSVSITHSWSRTSDNRPTVELVIRRL